MRATFTDPELQADLERDGYAVFDALSVEEIQDLRDKFEEKGPAPGDAQLACHSSFHSYDRDYKLWVDKTVRQAITPMLDVTFDRQRSLPCNFIMKWPGGMGGFGLHQDLSLVDEREHRSVEVWIPLEDTNENNGQLWMVPGSHQWIPTLRGIHAFNFPFRQVVDRIIKRHARPVPVTAGQGVVFNHATVHWSYPNKTDKPRLTVITDLIPEEATHIHYFGDGEGNVEAFEIGDEFWTDNSPFTLHKPPPASQSLGMVDYFDFVEMTDADLDRAVEEGKAIDMEASGQGAINSAKTWCHRCGETGFEAWDPDRLVGNVTMLCPKCEEAERALAPSPEHVGV